MKTFDVILPAAGIGKRLRPFTLVRPKGLNMIGGKTILQWQFDILNYFSINRMFIIVGYKKQILRAFLKDANVNFEVVILENNRYKSTGCSYSMMKALRMADRDIIYINSDLLFKKRAFEKVLNSEYENCVAARFIKGSKETVLQKIEYDKKFRVRRLALTLSPPYLAEAVGPLKFSFDSVKQIIKTYDNLKPELRRIIPCYSLFGVFAKTHHLYCEFINDGDWFEINTVLDYQEANNAWRGI